MWVSKTDWPVVYPSVLSNAVSSAARTDAVARRNADKAARSSLEVIGRRPYPRHFPSTIQKRQPYKKCSTRPLSVERTAHGKHPASPGLRHASATTPGLVEPKLEMVCPDGLLSYPARPRRCLRRLSGSRNFRRDETNRRLPDRGRPRQIQLEGY